MGTINEHKMWGSVIRLGFGITIIYSVVKVLIPLINRFY